MLRAVLDPGVLIAALISPRGAPAQLFTLWIEGAFELIASPNLLDELGRVLAREKFRRYVSEEEAARYVEAISRLAIVVRDPEEVPRFSADPNDDYLVALAREVAASVLVSGDPHLTELDDAGIEVVTPRVFLGRIS